MASGKDGKSDEDAPELMPIADMLAEEIDAEEALDPQAFYEAKLVSVEIGRQMGFSDAELEEALGIRLKPEDRKSGGEAAKSEGEAGDD